MGFIEKVTEDLGPGQCYEVPEEATLSLSKSVLIVAEYAILFHA